MKLRHIAVCSLFCGTALLAACKTQPSTETEGATSSRETATSLSSSRGSEESRETKNVTYTGVVKPAGISIFVEGTHRLLLQDGKFILLESEDVDVNGYVDERVEVMGAARPTVESDGVIMRVERISLVGVSSAKSQQSDMATSASLTSSREVAAQSSHISQAVQSSRATNSPEIQARAALMAKNDLTPSLWTQKYCTSHIGFCIPIHKNWWFTSFGATTSQYWHVEVSSEAIENLWDGPIHINLVSGSLASTGHADTEVAVENNEAVGYREWTGDRHFEIRGDAQLEGAVRYMTEHLETYDTEP